MNLREFLFFERKTIVKFAEELMVNSNYLTRIVNEKTKPSKRLAKAIEIATKNKVTAKEILSKWNQPKKP